ncbi:flagellar biosynthesis regulatory protein FlaF [Afipia sp. P52-10]|jgi:flagellar protein FlaF|uniref:flagellar biosynthesis regulator FlaF n=1 Tax=Afipia sp. P52-10 TaxID=1429916 RepID=UPI0003DF0AE5|nr:flagellar biosynthesis regulator FlaF [Afipia sp. P52-10]ETR75848.1 flagellar biosynthesis regulatory protein FlaF [Afipia sp. P52-10]
MSDAAKAYARVANTTAAPREIEAQALLKAANQLQDVVNKPDPTGVRTKEALLFNRKLWSIFMSDVLRDDNQQPLEVRQNIANIGIFVLTQTAALQINPQLDQFKSLIDINRNLAAGLSGRA